MKLSELNHEQVGQIFDRSVNKTVAWCDVELAEERVAFWMDLRLKSGSVGSDLEYVTRKLKFWTEVLARLQQKQQ